MSHLSGSLRVSSPTACRTPSTLPGAWRWAAFISTKPRAPVSTSCRSEERRGGKECVSTGRARWTPAYEMRISDWSSDVCSSDLADIDPATQVGRCEIFGPVVCLLPFATLDEAIGRVNVTPFGLATGIFTNRLQDALDAARRLEVGGVHINETSSSRVDLMQIGRAAWRERVCQYR